MNIDIQIRALRDTATKCNIWSCTNPAAVVFTVHDQDKGEEFSLYACPQCKTTVILKVFRDHEKQPLRLRVSDVSS